MFQKQAAMRRVLVSLAPIFLFSLWQYGLRAVGIAAVTFGLGAGAEFMVERKRGKKPSEAVLVTCALFALSMPPSVPLWIVAIGILFAVLMAKEVYGGFGRNVFNPAIAGRLFVYISFATLMQRSFVAPGGFGAGADAISGATSLAAIRAGSSADLVSDLLLGFRAGSLGESSSLLIILSGAFLLATKTASFRLMLSTIGSGIAFGGILLLTGAPKALPLESLLAGSFLFVAVFMSTDPVSAPKKPLAQWAYGGIIGACIVLIRTYSLFPEGTSFAVLLGNTFASFLDELAARSGRKAPAPGAVPASAAAAEAPKGGAQ